MNRATLQQLRYEKLGIINLTCKELILSASLSFCNPVRQENYWLLDFGKVKVGCFDTNSSILQEKGNKRQPEVISFKN